MLLGTTGTRMGVLVPTHANVLEPFYVRAFGFRHLQVSRLGTAYLVMMFEALYRAREKEQAA